MLQIVATWLLGIVELVVNKIRVLKEKRAPYARTVPSNVWSRRIMATIAIVVRLTAVALRELLEVVEFLGWTVMASAQLACAIVDEVPIVELRRTAYAIADLGYGYVRSNIIVLIEAVTLESRHYMPTIKMSVINSFDWVREKLENLHLIDVTDDVIGDEVDAYSDHSEDELDIHFIGENPINEFVDFKFNLVLKVTFYYIMQAIFIGFILHTVDVRTLLLC